jgi:hypothetical protein
MKTPITRLLQELRKNKCPIPTQVAIEYTQQEQEFLFKFVKTYYAPEFKPCDLGAEEMFEAELYLNLADFLDDN